MSCNVSTDTQNNSHFQGFARQDCIDKTTRRDNNFGLETWVDGKYGFYSFNYK